MTLRSWLVLKDGRRKKDLDEAEKPQDFHRTSTARAAGDVPENDVR